MLGKTKRNLTNYAAVCLIIFSSTLCFSQEKVEIDSNTLQDILLSEAEYKTEVIALKKDTSNLRLIIKNKDVMIVDYVRIIANQSEVEIGLQNALESVKVAYDEEKKNSKRKGFKRFIQGVGVGGFAVGAFLIFGSQ